MASKQDQRNGASKPELSAVDDDSKFEMALNIYVNQPVVKLIPYWIKPNTISILNNFGVWLAFFLSYVSVMVDESAEEYEQGGAGTGLNSARLQAFCIRMVMAALIFASLVMDCLDGMHARATKQTSNLGEVMDHALDAANIPLMSAATIISWSADIYTRLIAMVSCGLVFNSQLVIYKHTGNMIKPPSNGPESQMMLIVGHIIAASVLLFRGRFDFYVSWIMNGLFLFANTIQITNFLYFWRHFTSQMVPDHFRFALPVVGYATLYYLGLISDLVFNVGSVIIAFRLSGAYVLFTVANKHKKKQEVEISALTRPLTSVFSSLYDGWDWNVMAFVAMVAGVQWMTVTPSVKTAHLQLSGLTSAAFSVCTLSEVVLLFTFIVIMCFVTLYDLSVCLPYLVSSKQRNLLRLFI